MPLLKRLLQYRWTLSLLLLAVLPVSIWGAVQAFRSISNRVVDWMPDNFPATQEYYRFFGLFGSDELLMISWDDCRLDDPRIGPYRDALLAPVATPDGPRPLFREVIAGSDVLESYLAEPLKMSREQALDRMSGWIVSPDRRRTCLIALVATGPYGEADRHAAVAHVRAAADQVPGLSADQIHVAGPTIEGVAIDQASLARLLPLNFASFAICMLIMAICLRNVRAALVVLAIALFNEQLSMAIIHYCGTPMNSILLLTANLTFVLSISICIHWFNYYKDALRTSAATEAPLEACRAALPPTVLATLTTSLGLISLTVSKITPTYQFGFYSAICLIVAMAVAIVYAALHFSIWPLRAPPPAGVKESTSADSPALDRWVRVVRSSRWPVILIAMAVLVVGFFGVPRLRTAVGLKELLSQHDPVVRDYVWLEREIGPLNPVEIVLDMPPADPQAEDRERAKQMLRQFYQVTALHDALADTYTDYAVISIATFSRDPPPKHGRSLRLSGVRSVFGRTLLNRQQALKDLGYLLPLDDHHYWRITMRCPAMADVEYGQLLQDINSTIKTTLESGEGPLPRNVIVCGALPLVYQAQQQLLEDLIYSFILAFALVSLILMLRFQSIRCGLICMIPNIFPSALVFGLMGWRGTPVEFGTILTASAALGIAVDDSLHFIHWFRRKIREGGSIPEAVRYSYRRCAAAMVQTTLICSFGLVVFVFSPFAPIAWFGWCMFALLMLALVADLVVLPAILLSPLGRPFLPSDPARAPRTLVGFALRVAGPREFVIAGVINTLIAVWVFHGATRLPVTEGHSLGTYFTFMCFVLPLASTFFGFYSGVNERRSGRLGPVWPAGGRWLGAALAVAVGCAICVWGVGMGLLRMLDQLLPAATVPLWAGIGIIGLIAGVLGYVLHGLAVVSAGRLVGRSKGEAMDRSDPGAC